MLVQVEVALTDGTDLKTFRRGHPLLAQTTPSPFGHEFCGIVDGRRVVAANSAPCGTCAGCERGEQCRELEFLAGAYADWIVVPARIATVNLHDGPASASPPRSRRWSSRSPAACAEIGRAGVGSGARRSRSSGPGRSG